MSVDLPVPAHATMRGSTLVDGNAFRKIEGIVEGDRGSRVACVQMVNNN